MIDRGKQNLLGVRIDAVDYDAAVERIVDAARDERPYGVSALAVHGVMEAVVDPELRHRVNRLELVTADGQPVRWSLNLLHGTGLPDRCYGPTLMRKVCEAAAAADLPVFLYGSREDVVERLGERLVESFPGLQVAGTAPSRFAQVSPRELDDIAEAIRATGARIVFAGLGCPRQEVFAYELRERVKLPVLAVGAAFEYHAGLRKEPPRLIQRSGLQWLWRLLGDPRRLWKRYLTTNPAFVVRVAAQRLGLWRPDTDATTEPPREAGYA
jgi:N-acetylglucosaminyldiphosphoundecaprenol N-acetyl-beta-D-mannosaminyltransferase